MWLIARREISSDADRTRANHDSPLRHFAGVLLLLLMAVAGRGESSFARARDLAKDFRNPPSSARPWVYWFFMDGNLSREGITADLEAMQQAGIGGVIVMEVDVGIPKGPVRFMSEPWRALFKHAVTEAERLGPANDAERRPGLDRQRRAVGQARTIHAAHRRQRNQGDGWTTLRGSPSAAQAAAAFLRTRPLAIGGFAKRVLSRCRRAGVPDAGRRTRHCRPGRQGLVRAGAVFVAAGRQALPARAGEVPDAACDRPGQHRRPDGSPRRQRPAHVGCARGRLDHSAVRPHDHRREHPAGARARPGLRVRQVRSGGARRAFRCLRRHAAARDRPAAGRPHNRLDDAAHRQLGDGRAELEREIPRRVPAAARATIRFRICP